MTKAFRFIGLGLTLYIIGSFLYTPCTLLGICLLIVGAMQMPERYKNIEGVHLTGLSICILFYHLSYGFNWIPILQKISLFTLIIELFMHGIYIFGLCKILHHIASEYGAGHETMRIRNLYFKGLLICAIILPLTLNVNVDLMLLLFLLVGLIKCMLLLVLLRHMQFLRRLSRQTISINNA